MEILKQFLPNFFDIFYIAYLFVTHGGWVLFVIGLYFMLKFEYMEEIQGQYVSTIDWVFLEIRVPKENAVSTMAVESIFAQMHSLHGALTWEEIYVQGKFQLWYSLEIISMGGKVSFIIKAPRHVQHLVESAFYSVYPTAEIREVSDYMENFNLDPYNPDDEYDMFGTEWKMAKDDVIPLKTYKDFEHPTAEEKVIDPLKNVIETLERVKPHEFLGLQLLIQPTQNNEWEPRAKHRIMVLTGEEIPHAPSFWGFLMKPFDAFAHFSFMETFFGHGHHGHEPENKPKNNWLSMTEAQKEEVSLIEKKMNKAAYNAKMRILYIAPKAEYDKTRRGELVGALRHFSAGGGSGTHNTLKPDMAIWTKADALFSQALEKPFLEKETMKRKKTFLKGYKRRSTYIGAKKFLLSIEEIATLFHFPITYEGSLPPSQVLAVESKKSRPPANLPVAPR